MAGQLRPFLSGRSRPSGPEYAQPLRLTIRATGYPAPALAETGRLPDGLTFTDHGNGTATITGARPSGSSGHYLVTITATNTKGKATRHLTIIVS